MKKLSVEQELITAKYQYPATCTTYDKEGNITSKRLVTHSIAKTQELQRLYPELKRVISPYKDDEVVPAPATVKQLLSSLGQ